ncbi:histone deacetylase 6-like [Liolophura sinensis]|uniref:histone deacetylase 6-like n=1 Tax=Liolophura sinensis TaxID=3198878 RepID=UPI003158FF0E
MDKPPDFSPEGREAELEGMTDPDVSQSSGSDRQGMDSSDTSLNIQDLDPAALCNLITRVGSVPPLSPLCDTPSSQQYSSPETVTSTSEDYSTADTSWQSPPMKNMGGIGDQGLLRDDPWLSSMPRGVGEGMESEDGGKGNSGARPKDRQHMTRHKRRELLEKQSSGESGDEGIISQLKLLALVEKKEETPSSGTGFYYDEIFTKHKNEWDENYPECPERVSEPFARCCELGLVDRCEKVQITYGTEDLIKTVHTDHYLEKMKTTVNMTVEELRDLSQQYDSVYFNNMTYECSLVALGGVVELMTRILHNKLRNGFALIRPPGHHAEEDMACGYCMFNSVAIAARLAVESMGLERVLIIDWDVHHGQATQKTFYDDPRVLYFSIHRYEYGNFWPSLRESDYDYIGEGDGKGYNINVPLNKTGMTNSDYLAIFQQVLLPVAYEFSPQLVLVSAGYDAVLGCPEGEMEVTPACFPHLLHMVSSLAEGRVCVVLEGGYCLKSLSESVALTVRGLLGDPCPVIGKQEEPSQSITESILNVIKGVQPYWKCFQYQQGDSFSDTCPYPEVNTWPPKQGIIFSTPENRPEKYDLTDYARHDVSVIKAMSERIDQLIEFTSLQVAPFRTCLVFDPDMRAHKNHVDSGHPERPDRISRIFDRHVELGLFQKCLRVKAREATEEELGFVHRSHYIDEMQGLASMSPRELYKLQDDYNSVYICQESYHCAALATGGTLNVVDAVLTGKAQNGVAIVRPPGHHAEPHTAMGFCFFNTVAVAAKYAQKKYALKRVLILDWDVHHGNGTQHMLDDDPSVLFISLHRFDHGYFYPGSEDGDYGVVGVKEGKGFNVNIPWNTERFSGKHGMGDSEYITAFQQVVMPIAYEFCPELVLVSAGFDAARGDPLGGYDISPEGYSHMTHMLMSLANGNVILVLEGGYNLTSISNSMAACTSILQGGPCPQLEPLEPCDSAVRTIRNVLNTQKKYWKCLKFRVCIPLVQTEQQEQEDVSEVTDAMKDMSVDSTNTDGENSGDRKEEDPLGADITTEAADGACGGSVSAGVFLDLLSQQGYDAMYAVQPVPWCPHLDTVQPLPAQGLNTADPCENCGNVGENWVCLVCYKVYCSRFVNEHMVLHGVTANHLVVLSYADLSVWCYGCDTYVDNQIIHAAKSMAHLSKFGSALPGSSSR